MIFAVNAWIAACRQQYTRGSYKLSNLADCCNAATVSKVSC